MEYVCKPTVIALTPNLLVDAHACLDSYTHLRDANNDNDTGEDNDLEGCADVNQQPVRKSQPSPQPYVGGSRGM